MTYAKRRQNLNRTATAKFGVDASGAQLYCWHEEVQIPCYEVNQRKVRDLLAGVMTIPEEKVIRASHYDADGESYFETDPKPNDEILVGTTEASAKAYRIESANKTHVGAAWDLTLVDPRRAETAA